MHNGLTLTYARKAEGQEWRVVWGGSYFEPGTLRRGYDI